MRDRQLLLLNKTRINNHHCVTVSRPIHITFYPTTATTPERLRAVAVRWPPGVLRAPRRGGGREATVGATAEVACSRRPRLPARVCLH